MWGGIGRGYGEVWEEGVGRREKRAVKRCGGVERGCGEMWEEGCDGCGKRVQRGMGRGCW